MKFIQGVVSEIGTLKTPPKRMKRRIKKNKTRAFHSEGSLSGNIFQR